MRSAELQHHCSFNVGIQYKTHMVTGGSAMGHCSIDLLGYGACKYLDKHNPQRFSKDSSRNWHLTVEAEYNRLQVGCEQSIKDLKKTEMT